MTILITGSAGFIGFHVAKRLLERGDAVIGLDNFNDYYDVRLKEERNSILSSFPSFTMYRGDIGDKPFVEHVFSRHSFDAVCHLAAQAGVRYSLEHPEKYIQSNLVGFFHVIDVARTKGVRPFIYASSSSVYGANEKIPFSVQDAVDRPVSLYAATKKSNELIAYTYHHLYNMHCTGLRFFTVYGPYGRPDMAYFSFTKNISEGKPIRLFHNGKMRRDFTYIDDIVNGIVAAIEKQYPYEIFNLGNNKPVELLSFVETLEKALGKKAVREFAPLQPGDVIETYADITESRKKLGFEPKTSIGEGLGTFVEWYKGYYRR